MHVLLFISNLFLNKQGVIGPNGVGKTTLFNIISGNEQPEEGEIKIGSSVVTAEPL